LQTYSELLVLGKMMRAAVLAMTSGAVLVSSLFLASTMLLGVEATGQDTEGVSKFLSISSSSTEVKRWWDGDTIVSYVDTQIKVRGDIPLDGMSGTFGYAWLTDDLDNVLALVSHLPIDENSYQIPGPGLYT